MAQKYTVVVERGRFMKYVSAPSRSDASRIEAYYQKRGYRTTLLIDNLATVEQIQNIQNEVDTLFSDVYELKYQPKRR